MAWAIASTFAFSSPVRAQGALEDVNITASPLRSNEFVSPSSQLSGTGLVLRSRSSLGETLSGEPGVSSTYFGPQASRPIIRGQDGDRIRILSNSGASLDVSGLSYDHAVAMDPLIAERIELLRGPGTLLYGGNAIGGVVNVIDGRIPREAIQGVQGRTDLSIASGDRGRNGAAVFEAGNGRYAFHADIHARQSSDVSVPVALPCLNPRSPAIAYRICNSAASSQGGALGGTVFFNQGYLGASVSEYRSAYGSVAEDQVSLEMRSQRWSLEGLMRLGGLWRDIKLQVNHSDYRHTEFDAGEPGTLFTNRGFDIRLEARHHKWGAFEGVVGLQWDQSRFGAQGSEAFAPNARTRQSALFVYEEANYRWGKLSMGGRIEQVGVSSEGNPAVPRFVTGTRDFNPASLALGALLRLDARWQFTSNLTWNQRAPKDYELFANGPHLATAAYEVGDASLGKERAVNLDLGLAWRGLDGDGKNTGHRASANVFLSRFQNYLALEATGRQRGSDGGLHPVDANGDGADDITGASILPEYAYRQHGARLWGMELQGNWRLLRSSHQPQTLDLQWRADLVRGINTVTQASLPRLSPLRLGATLVWAARGEQAQGWGARFGLDHYARPADGLTQAYTFAHLNLTYQHRSNMGGQPARWLWYARLDNMTDRLAFSATSILTQTLPGRVPLPGRTLRLGLQLMF